jgi:hypothetical protein
MLVKDLLLWFEVNRTSNKNDLSNNVHKVYEAYRIINQDYINLDISIIIQDIDNLNNALINKYKPITTRNYLRYFLNSLDLPIIIANTPENIINNTKTRCKELLKLADKKANQKLPKESESINLSENLDINDIVAISEISDELNTDLLQFENKMLKDEVVWLRKVIELMASK